MKLLPKISAYSLWTLLVFILLITCACTLPRDADKISSKEEAYIDLKQMFTLVVPASWQRERIPVSSPRFSIDTIDWAIPSAEGPKSSLQIRSLALSSSPDLSKTFANHIQKDNQSATIEPLKFLHPAGPALRLDYQLPQGKTIYLAIQGPERIYIMRWRITENLYDQLLPVIERVILSFSILI